MKTKELNICLGCDDLMVGTPGSSIDKVSSLEKADEQSITWVSEKKKDKLNLILQSKAAIIICDKSISISDLPWSKCVILTNNPRLLFIRILNKFFVEKNPQIIHPSAIIYPHVKLGNNVCIHAGAVIGGDGFGYSRNEHGEMEKFPQIGGVVIGDNVEIGANTCIDRGTLDDTIIESGCKIDNLVHIAHNVHIKKNCVIIAHAMIGGSTVIEEGSWVAPSVALMNGITIGKGSVIGLGAVITKSVPENETWIGNPGHKLEKK